MTQERHGSSTFYDLLEEMANIHDRKSHDYASDSNPYGNYEFAGRMATMFSHSPLDAGFFGRLAEKIYRLKNLESDGKEALNESILDTERDIAVIATLWMAARQDTRTKAWTGKGVPEGEKSQAYNDISELAQSIKASDNRHRILSKIRRKIEAALDEYQKQMDEFTYGEATSDQSSGKAPNMPSQQTQDLSAKGYSGRPGQIIPERRRERLD